MKAILGPAGSSTSVSARRLAARKSRLSIIAEVSVRWLTIDPERGRQAEPVWTLEVLGGLVAKELHAVAALDQRHALGGEALQFDRADLRAVLFLLTAPLRLLVVVEFALDAIYGAVEEVDGRPEQVVEVGFEARVAEGCDQGVEDVGDGAGDGIAFGKRPRIGLVLEGTIAIELEFVEDVIGRG